MYYSMLFFKILVYASLVSLIAVFGFQIWAFIKDHQENKTGGKKHG